MSRALAKGGDASSLSRRESKVLRQHAPIRWWFCLGRCLLLLLLLLSNISLAQPPANTSDDAFQFRRVEVPEEQLPKYIEGYLPRRRVEFERLIGPKQVTLLPFTKATHRATFDGSLLKGTSSLDKSNLTSDSADKANTKFLELGQSIAITNPRWLDDDREQNALVGKSGLKTIVQNEAGATAFAFDWSARGKSVANESARFDLRFPAATWQQLEIDLPNDLELVADRGIVEPLPDTDGAASDATTWRVSWSDSGEIRLSIDSATPETDDPWHTIRYETSYRFRSGGVRVRSLLTIEPRSELLNQETIRIDVDPRLTISSVSLDRSDASVPLLWTRVGQSSSYDVELPDRRQRNSDRAFMLRIDASTPLVLGEKFELPKIRSNGRWLSETVRWLVDPALQVVEVQQAGGVCDRISMYNKNRESMEFTFDSDDDQLALRLQQETSELELASLVSVVLGEADNAETGVTVDVEARVRTLSSDFFELNLEVDSPEAWLFESVSATIDKPVAVSVLASNEVLQSDARVRRLQFTEGIGEGDSLTLRFRLRSDSLGESIPLHKLAPLRFLDAAKREIPNRSVWVYARSTSAVQLTLQGAQHTNWIQPDTPLPNWVGAEIAKDTELDSRSNEEILEQPRFAEDLFFELDDQSSLTTVKRGSIQALLSVKPIARLFVGADKTTLDCFWEIDSLGKEINSVDISFTHPLPNPPKNWSVLDSDEGLSYRVSFPPTNRPFPLSLQQELSGDPTAVPLPSVQRSTGERTKIGVYSNGTVGLDIRSGSALNAIPIGSFPAAPAVEFKSPQENVGTLHAAYAYDSEANTNLSLTVANEEMTVQSSLIAWRSDVRSFYAETGRPRHRADFYLQNDGVATFQLSFPKGYALDTVEIDGEKLSPQLRLTDGLLKVALPRGVRFPCVSVRYVEPETALRAVDWLRLPLQMSPLNDGKRKLQPDIPATNVSCLQTTWQVWLPRDYRAYPATQNDHDSWLERIFGPFGTPTGPTWGRAAWQEIRRRVVPSLDNTSVIDRIKSELGQPDWSALPRDRQQNTSSSETWGYRLSEVKKVIGRSRAEFRLLIDREELRRIGVSPDTPLPTTRYTRARQMGVDRLVQAGIGILFHKDMAIVTSASELKAGSGAELMDGIAALTPSWIASSRLHDVDHWKQQSTPLWNPSSEPLEIGFQQGGWGASRRTIQNDDADLKIYHRDTANALACGLFFVGYAWGWFFYPRKRALVVATSVGILCTLLLPKPGATFAAAFSWALVLSVLVRRLAIEPRSTGWRAGRVADRFETTRTAASILICLLVLCLSRPTRAQETSVESDRATNTTEQKQTTDETETVVYVPYRASPQNDNAIRKQTDLVYVPPQVDRLLNRRAGERELRPDYVLRQASYVGNWPNALDEEWIDIQAEFSVTTFASNSVVPIPLSPLAGSLDLDDNAITLNRRPAKLEKAPATLVNANGNEFGTVLVPRAGNHRLRVRFRTKIVSNAAIARLRFPILSLPNSQLRLNLPRRTRSVSVPNATSKLSDELKGFLRTDLGSADKVEVVVERSDTSSEDAQSVDQLILLKIGKTQAEMETRFRLEGEPRFKLRVSEPLSPKFEALSYGDWDSDTRILDTNFLSPDDGIQFYFPLPTSLGLLTVPRVVPMDLAVRSTQIAVVTTSPDVHAVPLRRSTTTMDKESFATAWGNLKTPPDFVASLEDTELKLRIQHTKMEENWNSEIAFYFDVLKTEFEAQIQLNPTIDGSHAVTMRAFRVPPQMKIETIEAATSLGVPLPIRSHRNGDRVTIFFLDDRTEISRAIPIVISLDGYVEDLDTLPLIAKAESDESYTSQTVDLLSTDGVKVTPGPTFSDAETRESISRPNYRHIGTWSGQRSPSEDGDLAAEALTADVEVSDNKFAGQLKTRLIPGESDWTAQLTVAITGETAMADVIYLDVPSYLENWNASEPNANSQTDPSETTTTLPVQLSGGVGLSRRIATIWLPKRTAQTQPKNEQSKNEQPKNEQPTNADTPKSEQAKPESPKTESPKTESPKTESPKTEQPNQPKPSLTRTVVLTAQLPENQIRLPQVKLLNIVDRAGGMRSRRWVDLPVRESSETSPWRTRGLFKRRNQPDRAVVRYRVDQEKYSAELTEIETGSKPEVYLLETHASWSPERKEFLVMAQAELKPALLKEVFVALPKKAELIHLFCDHVPVRLSDFDSRGSSRYRVRLDSAPWPQSIRVIYRVKPKYMSRGFVLEAPRLYASSLSQKQVDSIRINTQLWKVFSQGNSIVPQRSTIDQTVYDELFVTAFSNLWTNSQVSSREDRGEKVAWLTNWANRLRETSARLKSRPRADGDSAPDSNLRTLDQIVSDFPEMFDFALFDTKPLDGRHRSDDLWAESQWLSGKALLCASVGEQSAKNSSGFPSLPMSYVGRRNETLMRYLVGFALVGLVFSVPRLSSLEKLFAACRTYPHVALVVLGLLWWLALTPSWVGLVVAIGAMLLWAVTYLRARRMTLRT